MTREFVWTSDRVAEALRPEDRSGSFREYSGVSTDTRTLGPGELFVALRGERFDAVDFIPQAIEAGTAGVVVERVPEGVPGSLEIFRVEDSLVALGRLANYRRRALAPTVVAITGTSGKTTTRELVVAALGEGAYASPGNFNNLVGVPISMLAAPEAADIWVLELATNRPGEIGRLAGIVGPDHAVVTSISEGHLEGLGDVEGVIAEKLSLLDSLPEEGRAFVADEPDVLAHAARERHREVVTVGMGPGADEHPEEWGSSEEGMEWTWRGARFRLPGFGVHLIRNGLFAATVSHSLGIPPEAAAVRMARVALPPMRGEVRRLNGMTLLVDCYNANPSSFRAGLDALKVLAAGRRRVVFAGTMLELGSESAALHRRVAEAMVASGIDLVVAVDEFARAFESLGDTGSTAVVKADELGEAYRRSVDKLRGDEAVLIKASRGMRFERAVEMLERDFGPGVGSGVGEAGEERR